MMKLKFFVFILFAFTTGFILKADPCRKIGEKSCWSVENTSSHFVHIKCRLAEYTSFIAKVSAGDNMSHQYDKSWGDGLGFPEKSSISCSMKRLDGSSLELKFATLNWGDSVQIQLLNRGKVKVIIDEYWGRSEKIIEDSF